jgi:N-formylglutamate deformylase
VVLPEHMCVEIDRPFSGALVPMAFYRSDARVSAVMIEVNRRLYLDEVSGTAAAGFEKCRARLATVLNALRQGPTIVAR